MQFHNRVNLIAWLTLASMLFLLGYAATESQAAKKRKVFQPVWQDVKESSIDSFGERQIVPLKYRAVRLNKRVLSELLDSAPKDSINEAQAEEVIFELPLPDGAFSRFRIVDSPMMEDGLAKQYPEIKTFRGQGIDDPTATVRFDSTPQGFHAQILRAGETVYIDPFAKGETDYYISYEKSADAGDGEDFSCGFKNSNLDRFKSEREIFAAAPAVVNGTVLRTYRLALAATGEYTAFNGGTAANALAAMVTTMNRVNGIYERDLAIRMILVADNNSIIYADAANDPYTNSDGGAMLDENQANLDAVIGTANYDIGHVFSTGGGGVAALRVPCNASSKARGVTGTRSPVGDGFDVDYVAHEIGHQFGARHTFNGEASNCNNETRSSISAYEPGSGITIMAYAGICGGQDLARHSIDTFHARSLEEILNFVTNSGSCSLNAATTNTPPSISAQASFTIPKNTPFSLNAAGSDINGDALTYDWQQYNLGGSTIAVPNSDSDGTGRPLFRPFLPKTSAERTFPSLQYILNNANLPPATYDCGRAADKPLCLTGELLPTATQTMRFQAIVRDNRSGGGGINTALATVEVDDAKGPFQVTTQNSSPTPWQRSTAQLVLWSVNDTNVLAENVKISLSIDGGNSFPLTLASSTANDGSELVTLPNVSTPRARIKIEAVGNIFFDISDVDFAITAPTSSPAAIAGRIVNASGRGLSRVSVILSDESGLVTRTTTNTFGYYRFGAMPTGKNYVIKPSYKGYRFSPQIIVRNHSNDIADLNFTAVFE
jgi:hypothetical protein